MIGTLEFNSALYYRYAALNVDMLRAPTHLGRMTKEQRQTVVGAFFKAVILAVPGARKASMNASTLPGYVLGLAKEKGQPLQLVNAFLKPSKANLDDARYAMNTHHANLKRVWGLETKAESELSETGETTLTDFISSLTAHVL
jgi:CRISPR system Cascade subunit CasC